jgi:hypothetical protein
METLSELKKKPEAKKYVPKITTANNNPEPHIAKTTDPPDGSTDKPTVKKRITTTTTKTTKRRLSSALNGFLPHPQPENP